MKIIIILIILSFYITETTIISAEELIYANTYSTYAISYNYQKTNTYINNKLNANEFPRLKSNMQSVSFSMLYGFSPIDVNKIYDNSELNLISKINAYLVTHLVFGLSYTTSPSSKYQNSKYVLKYDFDYLTFKGGFSFPIYKSIDLNILTGLNYTRQNLLFNTQSEVEFNEFLNGISDSWQLNSNNYNFSISLGFDYYLLNKVKFGIISELFMNDIFFISDGYSSNNGLIIRDLPSNYLSELIFKFQLSKTF